MSKISALNDPNFFNSHNIIDASAGTGKTYTIERLFIRAILEKEAKINEILVITYTRRATEELAYRIKNLLEETIKTKIFLGKELNETQIDKLLKNCQLQANNYQIFTIHSFCLQQLQQYSMECKLPKKIKIDQEVTQYFLQDFVSLSQEKEYQEYLKEKIFSGKFKFD